MRNKFLLLIVLLTSILFVNGCNNKKEVYKENLLGIDYNTPTNESSLSKYKTDNPVVAMYIEKYGSVIIELYPDVAPNTVNNFISLVKNGFYDNNTFHRLIPGFVLQGGDPTGTGTGGPGYTIKGEFTANGFNNDLKHKKGIVSMARSQDNDSAGSQFFIMLGAAEHLDGQYAAFGKIIDGMDNVERIVDNEVVSNSETGQLQNNLVIKKALVDLKNNSFNEVEKIK